MRWMPESSRPSLRKIFPGNGSSGSVNCPRSIPSFSKARISPEMRVALGGRKLVGRSKIPPLETWYISFAVVLISRAMSIEETPAPMRRTFCQRRRSAHGMTKPHIRNNPRCTHLVLEASRMPVALRMLHATWPSLLQICKAWYIRDTASMVMTRRNYDGIENLDFSESRVLRGIESLTQSCSTRLNTPCFGIKVEVCTFQT